VRFQAGAPASWAGHAWAPDAESAAPLPPAGVTWPDVEAARPPLEWSDTLVVDQVPGSAWRGWSPGFVRAEGTREWPSPAGARAVIALRSGSFSRREHSVSFARGDSTRGLALLSEDRKRNPASPFGGAGDRMYGGVGRWRTRGQSFHFSYLNRAAAAALADGQEERLEGESGDFGWAGSVRGWPVVVGIGRGRTAQESFGPLPLSRREAQAWWGEAELAPSDTAAWRVRGSWRRPEVLRFGADAFLPRLASEWWLAARRRLEVVGGPLVATLGLGDHTGTRRFKAAPALEWSPGNRDWRGSLWLGRALAPVWTDLAPGQSRFVQDSWQGGTGVRWREPDGGSGARVALTVGRTRQRALLARRPLEEEWLRHGARADPEPYDFGLLSAGAAWRGRWAAVGAEGRALARERSPAQPLVDPQHVGLLWVEGRARLFAGDLGLQLRAELEGVGPRESEEPALLRLPGYRQINLAASLTLGEAMLVVRGLDLEDRRPEQVWLDGATGTSARAPGRDFQAAFLWRLLD
jgi:hypothetical protein